MITLLFILATISSTNCIYTRDEISTKPPTQIWNRQNPVIIHHNYSRVNHQTSTLTLENDDVRSRQPKHAAVASTNQKECEQINTPYFQVENSHQKLQNYEVFEDEIYPEKNYFIKPYSNMAFENCPDNVTGPIAYLWSCTQFLNCWKGRGIIQNCAPGTKFNPQTLECDYAEKVDCISGPHNQKVKFEKYVSQSEPICRPKFSGLLPHPEDCTKFVNCANGLTFVQDCGPGTSFNPVIQTCDYPHRTGCKIDAKPRAYRQNFQRSCGQNCPKEESNLNLPTLKEVQNQNQYDTNRQNCGQNCPTVNRGCGTNCGPNIVNEKCQNSACGYQPQGRNDQTHKMYPDNQPTPGINYNYQSSQRPQFNVYSHQTSQGHIKGSSQARTDQTNYHIHGGTRQIPNPNYQTHQVNSHNYHEHTPHHPINSQVHQEQAQHHQIHPIYRQTSQTHQVNSQSHRTQQTQTHPTYHQINQQHRPNTNGPQQNCGSKNCITTETQSTATRQNCEYCGQSSVNCEQNKCSQLQNLQNDRKERERCPNGHTGLLPHPFICEKFLNCANGITYIQDCGPGTVFNPNLQACDWPYNVKCVTQKDSQVNNFNPQNNQNFNHEHTHTVRQTNVTTNHDWSHSGQTNGYTGLIDYRRPNLPNSKPVATVSQTNVGSYSQSSNTRQNQQGQTNGYTGIIGYRRPNLPNSKPVATVSQTNVGSYSQSGNTRQNQQNKFPLHAVTEKPNFATIQHEHNQHMKQLEEKYQHIDILEPATPTVLNYTINVQENHSKNRDKHWPPPFPSTDTSADYYFEETTNGPQYKDVKVWKSGIKCPDDTFECSVNECIPKTWVCDGNEDCSNSLDEKNCNIYLEKFTTFSNSRLYKHEVEKWLNTNLDTCAKYCLNSKSFQCKSFNFRRDENVCLLCDTNQGLSGSLATSHLYDYYELSALSVNCTNMYICPNKKCINYTQICNGKNDCGDLTDEKNCTAESIGYEIKLAGSQMKHEGRIEVKVFNQWGYICDDNFGLRNADVVCKELGFSQGAVEIKSGSYFASEIPENETFYLMDDVQCLGNETSVKECDFNGWGVHNCMPQEIVGLVCRTNEENCPNDHWKCDTTNECLPLPYLCDSVFDCQDRSDEGNQHCEAPIELRLMNGSSKLEGRVEVRYHGVWGTICDDDFNDMTAKVICQSLGYHGSAVAKKDGAFGPGIGPIWLDQLNCFGNETFIQECFHWNWGEHNCEHAEDAGVVCSRLDTTEFEKKSKDVTIIETPLVQAGNDNAFVSNKCGYRGNDLFTDESNEDDDVHFRVVKGSAAKRGDYPWQATIRVKGKLKSSHWCGAVIISNKIVLTAAHCLVGFTKASYVIRAGDYNVDEHEGTEVEAYIEDFFVHEKFRQGGHMNNDIAIIKLKGKGLKLSKQVQPICLPNKNTVYKSGLNCTISGFGSTETGKTTSSRILRAGWITIQSENVCKMPQVYGESITSKMFCAGSLDEGVDSCDGDSGGPLACLDKGLFTLYGITSWGQRCGHINKPGVYVKVSEYRDWIDEIIRKNT